MTYQKQGWPSGLVSGCGMERGCSSLSILAMIEIFPLERGEWLFLGRRTEEIRITNPYAFPKRVQEVLAFGRKVDNGTGFKYPLTQVLGAYSS